MTQKNQSYDRYNRQVRLKEFGEAGQEKLLQAKVLVAGAGGLGCPVLQYLVGAGVGTIGIADDDTVALTDLHRQVLYTIQDIGLSKAERAASILGQMNPGVKILSYNERLTVSNTLDIFNKYDIIVDATDNFPTRYMINDACVLLGKPLVFGAVSQFEGQVAVFNCTGTDGMKSVNYRDLFPQPPAAGEIQNCSEAGVLGVLTGIIGTLLANETVKLIAGIGQPLVNRLLNYNALNNDWYELELSPQTSTISGIPENRDEFMVTDYMSACLSDSQATEISGDEFNQFLNADDVVIIDTREQDVWPVIEEFSCLSLSFLQINKNIALIKGHTIILFCQSGQRSLQAARYLSEVFGNTKKIYSLKGGIVQWKKQYFKKEFL